MWWAARSVDRGDVGRTDNAGRIMLRRHECVCAACVLQGLVRRSCNCLREKYVVLRMLRASVLERRPMRRAARNWRRGGVGRTDNAGRTKLWCAVCVRLSGRTSLSPAVSSPPVCFLISMRAMGHLWCALCLFALWNMRRYAYVLTVRRLQLYMRRHGCWHMLMRRWVRH